jgi:uncharacterized membrane protein YgcG
MGLLGGLHLMQPNAAAGMMPAPGTAAAAAAAADAAAAVAAATTAAAAAAAAAATAGGPAGQGVPRSRALLRQQLQQEYEQAGLTRRLTSLDLQVGALKVMRSSGSCSNSSSSRSSSSGGSSDSGC